MKRLITCFVASCSLLSGAAMASPALQVKAGTTTIILNESLLPLFEQCDVDRIKPTVIRPQGDRWRLMVSGGAIDSAENSYAGELNHEGGVTISCGEDPVREVSLQNFRLDNLGESPVLTAIVVEVGQPLQRQALFVPGVPLEAGVSNGGVIRLSGVDLALTSYAAELFNALWGGAGLVEGNSLGEAITRVKILPSSVRGNGDGNKKEKDKHDHDDHDHDHDHDHDEEEKEAGEGS